MNTDLNRINRLHLMLNEYVEHEQIPGLSVGIVWNGNQCFAGEYGTANKGTGAPVLRDTLFHQASVSKTFVATGIMQLVEQGKIDLDAPIMKYLSYFKLDDERYGSITVRQLLNHTSGMPDENDYAWDRPEYDEQSLERYVRSSSHLKLQSDPGDKFAYSNIGYEILGDLIAKVSGLSFEHYMKSAILEPIGMRSSSFLKQEVEERLAAPHVLGSSPGYGGYVSDVFPYNRAHAPSSTLYTSADDMCRYLQMHVNQGIAGNGYSALQSGSHAAMWKPHAETGYDPKKSHIGLGWFMGDYKGSRILSHAGWDTGFLTHLFILPDDQIGIAVMANSDYVWLDNVSFSILDQLLGFSDMSQIKRSLAHQVASLAVSDGVEQAMEEYQRILREEPESYYLSDYEFVGITEALARNNQEQDAMIRILSCGTAIAPESSTISSRLQELRANKMSQ
ncbi:serine hydrolase [Paenibacillus sp. CF384]|uniref:serine hydrolase domain-containing protein n=1 Tax=Paenibacillus sp. CF384 TaxID=1884382 RepID=UPI000894DB8E|nr:serine hydrolase domain-containing protein [Paenibacillus sp. CF384]SDX49767.1 putative ATP-binding cassette transporter [Paenibacillus sp. CF384]